MARHVISLNPSIITLEQVSSVPLYRQLYERLRVAMRSGKLPAGARLPSTRALASSLGISRHTVLLAYDQLLAEGYLEGKVGVGTSVARSLPALPAHAPARASRVGLSETEHATPLALSRAATTLTQIPFRTASADLSPRGEPSAFQVGVPALSMFPYSLWTQIVARHLRHSSPDLLTYQDPAGYRPLREAIATHIGMVRGVHCTAEQVLIVAGAQAGLDLAARVLLDPGDAVWIEEPGYLGTRGALLGAGAHLIPVPVDAEGLNVTTGITRGAEARLACVTPAHQFPLGMTMSLARRLALLDWATRMGAWILEDDYDSEYRYSGRPLEALQGLDRAGRVIYSGTFSKVLFPALRLGYLVVPPALVDAFVAVRRFVDTHVPILEQRALAEFMTEGHFARHIRRMRTLYAQRRAILVNTIALELGEVLDVSAPEAGMHLVGWLPEGMDDTQAARQAATQMVTVRPLSLYHLEPTPRGGLLLGYAAIGEQEIHTGVRRLATALRSLPCTSSLSCS